MQRSITRMGPDDGAAEISQEGAAKNAGSKHPSAEQRPDGGGGWQQKKQRPAAAPAISLIFPKVIKVLIVHKTLWCTCAECREAMQLVCENSEAGGGLLQHKEVDRVLSKARGDVESMRQLLTSPRVIVAVHPEARAGALR